MRRSICFLIGVGFAVLAVLPGILTGPLLAAQLPGDPGDLYIFPAQSPVAPDGTSQQGGPVISGNLVFWTEYAQALRKTRVFFKDLSKGPGEPGRPLIADENSGNTPAVNGAANRVVWAEQFGTRQYLYYMDAGAEGAFSTCPGTIYDCATLLSPGQYWQAQPSISPDGTKVAWEFGRSHDKQIYLYDFETGVTQELYGMPDGDQQFPSVDNEWVVWEDNRNYNDFLYPLDQYVYAKRIGSSDPPITLSYNGHSAHASVGDARVTRNDANEPVAAFFETTNDRYGRLTNKVHLYNLATFTDEIILEKQGSLRSLKIDGNKIVWLNCTENTSCDVELYDLSAGVTQTVSQDPALGSHNPAVSASTGYIVWRTIQQNPATVYYNRGDRAHDLAVRFAPHLYLHHEEYFQPRNVNIFVGGDGTRLMDRNHGDTHAVAEWPQLSLLTLGRFNRVEDAPGNEGEGKYLDLPGNVGLAWTFPSEWVLRRDYVDRYNDLAGRPEYPEQYYARVVANPGRDRFALQYWIPYYFNNFTNYHEGDWEMVQVDLDADFEATGAAFSQHAGATKRWWGYLEHRETHPVAFVGRGSHANYFAAGEHRVNVENWRDSTDYAEAGGPIHEPLVEVLPDVSTAEIGTLADGPFAWLAYQGAWGEFSQMPWLSSPQGPAGAPEHNAVWDDPFAWYDGLPSDGAPLHSGVPYDESYYSLGSPADIHLYDKAGNHVGKNASGGIDEQIPGAEYLEIPELHRKTILVHGGDAAKGYRLVLDGTGEGTFDLTIGSPNHASNTSDTVEYVDVPVNAASAVEFVVSPVTDYALDVDNDGDGLVDGQRLPDSVTRYDIDLTAPSAVRDLALKGASSGTATLSFTAPGDDANAGTAEYYDVRYSTLPITEDNWKNASPVESIGLPQAAGSPETVTVTGLEAGISYHFALKAKDEVMHPSSLSNIVQGTILIPEITSARRSVYWASWQDYQNRHLSVTYRITNVGSGTAIEPAVQASFCIPSSVYAVTGFPVGVGDIAPSAYADVTLKYYVPNSVYSFTATTFANCRDDTGRLYWFPEPLT